jgi:hypothetical protein
VKASVSLAAGRPGPILIRTWIGVALPPAGWIADFLVRYSVMRFVSMHGTRWPLHVCTAVGLLCVVVGAALCLGTLRSPAPSPELRTMARWGLALAAFFLLLVAAEAFPVLVLAPHEIT